MHRMSDLDLILEVQKYPLLYDTSLQAYQDSPLKNQAWLAIAKHTKVPVAECRKRWHALRDKFRRQLKQEESGEVKVVEWELMNPLRFVQPFMKRRAQKREHQKEEMIELLPIDEGTDNLSTQVNVLTNQPGDDDAELGNDSNNDEEERRNFVKFDQTISEDQKLPTMVPENQACSCRAPHSITMFSNRKTEKPAKRKRIEPERKLQEITKTPTFETSGFDAEDLFFASMAQKTKKIPEERRWKVHVEIIKLINNELYGESAGIPSSTHRPHP